MMTEPNDSKTLTTEESMAIFRQGLFFVTVLALSFLLFMGAGKIGGLANIVLLLWIVVDATLLLSKYKLTEEEAELTNIQLFARKNKLKLTGNDEQATKLARVNVRKLMSVEILWVVLFSLSTVVVCIGLALRPVYQVFPLNILGALAVIASVVRMSRAYSRVSYKFTHLDDLTMDSKIHEKLITNAATLIELVYFLCIVLISFGVIKL